MARLIETLDSKIPFRQPDSHVGASQLSKVYGYDSVHAVLKVPTGERYQQEFKTVDAAVAAAGKMRRVETTVAERIEREGGREGIVPVSSPVIYEGPTGGAHIARVQAHIEGARTLGESGRRVLHMPDETLQDIRSIMKASLGLWKDEGRLFPIMGSLPERTGGTYLTGVANRLLPLFRSRNIVTNGEHQVYFIDTPSLTESKSIKELDKWVGKNLLLAGTVISLGVINGVLQKRKISGARNR